MLKYLLKGSLWALALRMLADYRNLSMDLLKIEIAKSYLYGVRMARASAIGLMQMGLIIALIGVGALLLHAGLFILLPWSVTAKAVLGMILGMVYMLGGGFALRAGMDERTWMEKSGAAKMLKEAVDQSEAT